MRHLYLPIYSHEFRISTTEQLLNKFEKLQNGYSVRFPLEEIEYLIFKFFRSGVEANRGVDLFNIHLLLSIFT